VRTADYLLAHRIPKPVQALLKVLPAPLACRVLLAAIRRHAWTFAGSGRFSASGRAAGGADDPRQPAVRGVASDTPACDFYAATFEHLFRVLVHPRARCTETSARPAATRLPLRALVAATAPSGHAT
jgi:divinyl protochlorophyllide a 8-vinyl-reductase